MSGLLETVTGSSRLVRDESDVAGRLLKALVRVEYDPIEQHEGALSGTGPPGGP